MNSQHKHTHIAQNLKCFILVVDNWVINTLYTTLYLPTVVRGSNIDDKGNTSFINYIIIWTKSLLFSLHSIITSNVVLLTNIKSKKVRENTIFKLVQGNKYISKYMNHHILLEWVWTLVPMMFMIIILFISLILLYSAYTTGGLWITTYIIKIIGSQWFWTYEVLNNITNIHYIDFYAKSVEKDIGILFSLISDALPHMSYIMTTDSKGNNFTTSHTDLLSITNATMFKDSLINNTIITNSNDKIIPLIMENKVNINTENLLFENNNDSLLKNNYSEFLGEIRMFSKSEERIHFYETLNQWYSNDEQEIITGDTLLLPNYKNIIFDSNILKNTYLNEDRPLRLLDVDNRLYLSISYPIDFYITTNDVIHSYAVPSFGIKLDGLPGRINYGCSYILRSGIYYGQCSELCGINHAYMPTCVVALDKNQVFDNSKLLEHIHLYQLQ